MNGFANTILTVLLGWVRGILGSVWRVLGSDEGGAFLGFMRSNWLVIVIALCAAGLIVDVIVYLLRWRPYYVWGTKLDRLKRRARGTYEDESAEEEPDARQYAPEEVFYPPVYDEEPSDEAFPSQSFAPEGDTLVSPAYSPYKAQARYYEPVAQDPAFGIERGYGASRPDPESYLLDVQAGFAPPPAPEALYGGSVAPIIEGPIHPGLDIDTFQQNIGLADGYQYDAPQPEYAREEPQADSFEPEFFKNQTAGEQPRAGRALSAFAKKARALVSPAVDDDGLSIRDLQPMVDIKSAFHAPVYPKKPSGGYEE